MAIGFDAQPSAATTMTPDQFFAAPQHQLPWFLSQSAGTAVNHAPAPVSPQRTDSDLASVTSSDSEFAIHASRVKSATRRSATAGQRRRKWTKSEDRMLQQAVEQVTACRDSRHKNRVSWARVAKLVPRRSAKQCRDRWNTVAQGLKKREWTAAEDKQLLRLYVEHKNQWVLIASEMEGRNDNMVKSRFRSLMKSQRYRSMLRKIEDGRVSSSDDDGDDESESFSALSTPPSPQTEQQQQQSLPPAPLPMTMRQTSDLFSALSFADGLEQRQQSLAPMPMRQTSVASSSLSFADGQQFPLPPTPAPISVRETSDLFAGLELDEELGQWCSGL